MPLGPAALSDLAGSPGNVTSKLVRSVSYQSVERGISKDILLKLSFLYHLHVMCVAVKELDTLTVDYHQSLTQLGRYHFLSHQLISDVNDFLVSWNRNKKSLIVPNFSTPGLYLRSN